MPAVQTEANRRAVAMFGADWNQKCYLTHDHRGCAIAFDAKMLYFGRDEDCEYLLSIYDGIETDLDDGSAASLTFLEGGDVRIDRRFINKKLNDTADGRAAFVKYFSNTNIIEIAHYFAGKVNDTAEGHPAHVEYFRTKQIKFLFHYCDGEINDPKDGTPAFVRYYPSGCIHSFGSYRNNSLTDASDGSPAGVEYSKKGEIVGGFSSVFGELTAEETIKMIKNAQVYRVAELLAKADQSVVPAGMPPEKLNLAGKTT